MSKLNLEEIYTLLSEIKDPEIPVLTIQDLGILKSVKIIEDVVNIYITPTYSGCPAMRAIEMDIEILLNSYHIKNKIHLILSPAWNTDMISEEGRKKMFEYGITPPVSNDYMAIKCPQCKSENTSKISEFGSTSCKSLYKCNQCLEPFDYFKCSKLVS